MEDAQVDVITEISRAIKETNKLLRNIENMPPGKRKDKERERAQKLKGDSMKDLLRESKPIWSQISMNVEKRGGG